MLRLRLALVAVPLLLSACTRTDAPEPAAETPVTQAPATPEASPARMEGGVQVAEMTVDAQRYTPAAIALEAGVPARLVITRTAENSCATEVHAPELGVPKTPLPLGEPVAVTFTPSEAGTFTLACGMDMLSAAVIVRS
jgi:plastocyanin domain-containing protein